VLVLALNPSIDAEWRVDYVLWEEKNNVHSERRWAGGKGINVARWLKQLGGKPQLLLPLGGQTGAELGSYLRAEKLPAKIIPLREPTRVNVILTTKRGRQMRFNPLGPKLSPPEWRGILNGVRQALASLPQRNKAAEPLLILSGSLPRGVPVTAYNQFIRLAHRYGVKTLLDCDGPVLAAAIKARPFLVKPNGGANPCAPKRTSCAPRGRCPPRCVAGFWFRAGLAAVCCSTRRKGIKPSPPRGGSSRGILSEPEMRCWPVSPGKFSWVARPRNGSGAGWK
jgi:hypothetical protein